ncbi:MAG: nucleotidyl transferase AbiEii/AbiGii toxin family protein [Endomicrobium sp.]|jgi:predicted nucleotidyltransferase component of viral defense system|nr:nucleotidyl transferase AbiEii/AbiGii toxin family protein [Endomicrobium sp.]
MRTTQRHETKHLFVNQFGESLVNTGLVQTFSLEESLAEKMRTGATRETIAPRDFYDGVIEEIIKGFSIKIFNEKYPK